MASILSKLDELGNGDNGNNDVPDLLRKYVLGSDYSGRDLYEIFDYDDTYTFYNDANSITDAHDIVIYLNEMWGGYLDPSQTGYFYIKYNNAGYKIIVEYEYDSVNDEDICTTRDVIKIYEPSGMEGQIVEYKAKETDANATDWLVLYDNGNTVDITPITIDNSWSYTLGKTDSAAVTALPSGTDLERAIWSYNNAVDTLNAYCGTIVTNSTKQAVRSIGTGFGQADTSTMYSSTFLTNNPAGQADEGDYNGVGKVGDMNAEQDVVRMSYFSSEEKPHPYGYAAAGTWYSLASRGVYEYSDNVDFNVRGVSDDRPRVPHPHRVGCQHWGCFL